MPEYTYECENCGQMTVWQGIFDDKIDKCPKCGGEIKRLIGGGQFTLKGGCWSKDGYRK